MATAISVNRAGKVRAQTPVMQKTEKPKKKTGRAALRVKYLSRKEKGYFDAKGQVKLNSNVKK